jgi:hypothetical protein
MPKPFCCGMVSEICTPKPFCCGMVSEICTPKPLDVLNHAKTILLWNGFRGLYSKTIRCT